MMLLGAAFLASVALAPHPGPYVSTRDADSGGAFFTVLNGSIRSGAVAPTGLRCNRKPAVISRSIRIDGASFHYSGRLRGQRARIRWRGRWTSTTRVSGTVEVRRGRCAARTRWSAMLRPRERFPR